MGIKERIFKFLTIIIKYGIQAYAIAFIFIGSACLGNYGFAYKYWPYVITSFLAFVWTVISASRSHYMKKWHISEREAKERESYESAVDYAFAKYYPDQYLQIKMREYCENHKDEYEKAMDAYRAGDEETYKEFMIKAETEVGQLTSFKIHKSMK